MKPPAFSELSSAGSKIGTTFQLPVHPHTIWPIIEVNITFFAHKM